MTLASPAESHTRASVALFKLERFAEAAEEARTALAITPDDNIALRTLARSTLSLGDIEGTIAALTDLLPSSVNEAVAGIRALLRHGEVQAAARVSAVAPARIESCDSEVLPRIVTLLRQQALRKQNPAPERMAAFEMALALAPDNAALRIDFLRLLASAGEAGAFAHNAKLVTDATALADASATLARDVGNRARQAFRDQRWQEAHEWLQAGGRLGLEQAAGDLAERIKARRLAEARKVLVAKEPAGKRDPSMPEVREGITQTLRNRKMQVLQAAYISSLRNTHTVVNRLADRLLFLSPRPTRILHEVAIVEARQDRHSTWIETRHREFAERFGL